MHKLKHVYDTFKVARSLCFLFTLTIAFIAIFDYYWLHIWFSIQHFTFISPWRV